MGGCTYLIPLVVLLFSNSLLVIVGALAVSRLFILLLYLLFCLFAMPALRHIVSFELTSITPLLRFGGWITVSNIVSPAMTYLDRFLITALVSIASVAYYATPYTVVINLLILPFAIAGVLFPAFTATIEQDPKRARLLFIRGIKSIFIFMFPIVLLLVAFARNGLDLWLGKEFAEHSTRVLQFLSIGIFFNSLAQIPFNLVQSAGKPDLTAKLHLIELPFYLVAVWWMTSTSGIAGTAAVWSARAIVDAIILIAMARRILPKGSFGMIHAELPGGLAMLVLLVAIVPKELFINGGFVSFTFIIFVCVGWFLVLDKTERSIIHNFIVNSLHLVQRKPNA